MTHIHFIEVMQFLLIRNNVLLKMLFYILKLQYEIEQYPNLQFYQLLQERLPRAFYNLEACVAKLTMYAMFLLHQ